MNTDFWIRIISNIDVVGMATVFGVIIGWLINIAQLREAKRQTKAMEVSVQFRADAECEILKEVDTTTGRGVDFLVFRVMNKGLRDITIGIIYFFINGKYVSVTPNKNSGTMPYILKPGTQYCAAYLLRDFVEFMQKYYPNISEGELIVQDQCKNEFRAKWKVDSNVSCK